VATLVVAGVRTLLLLALVVVWQPAQAQPVRSLLEIRHERVVIQTWDTSCAAAALATVLTYTLNDTVSEKAVAQGMLRKTNALRVKVRGGFSLLDMKRFLQARGYSAVGYRDLSLDELIAMPSSIVPIEEYGGPHFVVVRGMRDGLIDIADPAFGNRRMPLARFLEVWREGIGFTVTRPKA
jgi:predicted double-glycine peptidase